MEWGVQAALSLRRGWVGRRWLTLNSKNTQGQHFSHRVEGATVEGLALALTTVVVSIAACVAPRARVRRTA